MLKERREIEQKPIYDENGRIEYYIIPNYKIHKEFLTKSERKFYIKLLNVIKDINKKNDTKITIFSQVAVNRLIDINNERIKNLYDEIENKSIDFVLYDMLKNEVVCCIELDDETHINNIKRQERDYIIDKMFDGIIKLVHIKRQDEYDENEILNKIKE